MDSVDYVDTFITVAPDSVAAHGSVPPAKDPATVAALSHQLLADAPYAYTSGDVIFTVWATRRGIPQAEWEQARREFYAKPQACLRSSDLPKRYGWGIHCDAEGRIALYGVDSVEYQALASGVSPFTGTSVAVTAAMRSRRG